MENKMRRLSKKALEARRRNAKKSTGPKSKEGKSVVSRNALKHGLSLPITYFPEYQKRVDSLAFDIAKHCMKQALEIEKVGKNFLTNSEDSSDKNNDKSRYKKYFDQDVGKIKNEKDILVSASILHAASLFAEAQMDLERIRAARIEAMIRDITTVYLPNKADRKMAETVAEYMSTPEKAAETLLLASLPRHTYSQPPTPKKYAPLASLLTKLDRYERRALAKRRHALQLIDELFLDLLNCGVTCH